MTSVPRLAVYTDYTYRRRDGRVYAERAFALFLLALAERLDGLVIAGKVDPRPGRSHYKLGPEVEFVELPYFQLTRPLSAAGAVLGSAIRFWRLLGEVDGVWLLGPHPLAMLFAALARLRRRTVALGVRQDFPRYVRARHPDRRWMWAAGDLLESIWRRMARRFPTVAVGPELASMYPEATVLELSVSLVRERDIAPPDGVAPNYAAGELRALSVGRLEQEKNPLLLADILAELVRNNERWRLTVCGEGPLEQALRERLAKLGVADRADLLGYVANDGGLREIYRSSHALLHVSLTEGVPQVLFEAFAARLPIVATDVGGVRAATEGAALLVAAEDASAAAAALTQVVGDPELRMRLTSAGAELVGARTLEIEAERAAAFLTGATPR
ncbi:MAG: glycosyltransferase family 4 protein [Solirubrobacteraceae bacterium]